MSEKINISEIAILSSEATNAIKKINEKKENGEEINEKTIEALRAINIASNTIDSIMSGRQIDMAFFKYTSSDIIKRLEGDVDKDKKKKRVKRKRKLYFKDKS
jgi:hypothetical protein